MIDKIRHRLFSIRLWVWAIIAGVLLGSAYSGYRGGRRILFPLMVGVGGFLLLQQLPLGLLAIVPAALVLRRIFATGTALVLNMVMLLVIALLGLWIIRMVLRRAWYDGGRCGFAGGFEVL